MKKLTEFGIVRTRVAIFVFVLTVAVGAAAVVSGAAGGSVRPLRVAPKVLQEEAEQEAVLAVVRKFFETMTAKDAAGASETLVAEGVFTSVRPGTDASASRTSPFAAYIEGLSSGTRLQEERMWDPVVTVHEGLATVWTPYDFHNDGELSHCGIDAFLLIKTASEWKIASAAYTVEPDGCAALGQPPRAPLDP